MKHVPECAHAAAHAELAAVQNLDGQPLQGFGRGSHLPAPSELTKLLQVRCQQLHRAQAAVLTYVCAASTRR